MFDEDNKVDKERFAKEINAVFRFNRVKLDDEPILLQPSGNNIGQDDIPLLSQSPSPFSADISSSIFQEIQYLNMLFACDGASASTMVDYDSPVMKLRYRILKTMLYLNVDRNCLDSSTKNSTADNTNDDISKSHILSYLPKFEKKLFIVFKCSQSMQFGAVLLEMILGQFPDILPLAICVYHPSSAAMDINPSVFSITGYSQFAVTVQNSQVVLITQHHLLDVLRHGILQISSIGSMFLWDATNALKGHPLSTLLTLYIRPCYQFSYQSTIQDLLQESAIDKLDESRLAHINRTLPRIVGVMDPLTVQSTSLSSNNYKREKLAISKFVDEQQYRKRVANYKETYLTVKIVNEPEFMELIFQKDGDHYLVDMLEKSLYISSMPPRKISTILITWIETYDSIFREETPTAYRNSSVPNDLSLDPLLYPFSLGVASVTVDSAADFLQGWMAYLSYLWKKHVIQNSVNSDVLIVENDKAIPNQISTMVPRRILSSGNNQIFILSLAGKNHFINQYFSQTTSINAIPEEKLSFPANGTGFSLSSSHAIISHVPTLEISFDHDIGNKQSLFICTLQLQLPKTNKSCANHNSPSEKFCIPVILRQLSEISVSSPPCSTKASAKKYAQFLFIKDGIFRFGLLDCHGFPTPLSRSFSTISNQAEKAISVGSGTKIELPDSKVCHLKEALSRTSQDKMENRLVQSIYPTDIQLHIPLTSHPQNASPHQYTYYPRIVEASRSFIMGNPTLKTIPPLILPDIMLKTNLRQKKNFLTSPYVDIAIFPVTTSLIKRMGESICKDSANSLIFFPFFFAVPFTAVIEPYLNKDVSFCTVAIGDSLIFDHNCSIFCLASKVIGDAWIRIPLHFPVDKLSQKKNCDLDDPVSLSIHAPLKIRVSSSLASKLNAFQSILQKWFTHQNEISIFKTKADGSADSLLQKILDKLESQILMKKEPMPYMEIDSSFIDLSQDISNFDTLIPPTYWWIPMVSHDRQFSVDSLDYFSFIFQQFSYGSSQSPINPRTVHIDTALLQHCYNFLYGQNQAMDLGNFMRRLDFSSHVLDNCLLYYSLEDSFYTCNYLEVSKKAFTGRPLHPPFELNSIFKGNGDSESIVFPGFSDNYRSFDHFAHDMEYGHDRSSVPVYQDGVLHGIHLDGHQPKWAYSSILASDPIPSSRNYLPPKAPIASSLLGTLNNLFSPCGLFYVTKNALMESIVLNNESVHISCLLPLRLYSSAVYGVKSKYWTSLSGQKIKPFDSNISLSSGLNESGSSHSFSYFNPSSLFKRKKTAEAQLIVPSTILIFPVPLYLLKREVCLLPTLFWEMVQILHCLSFTEDAVMHNRPGRHVDHIPEAFQTPTSAMLSCRLKPSLLLEALRPPYSRPVEQCNYERLEFLGDALLKFLISIDLFVNYENWSCNQSLPAEGSLNQRRCERTNNRNLIQTSLSTNKLNLNNSLVRVLQNFMVPEYVGIEKLYTAGNIPMQLNSTSTNLDLILPRFPTNVNEYSYWKSVFDTLPWNSANPFHQLTNLDSHRGLVTKKINSHCDVEESLSSSKNATASIVGVVFPIPEKVYADVVEALIGAVFVNGIHDSIIDHQNPLNMHRFDNLIVVLHFISNLGLLENPPNGHLSLEEGWGDVTYWENAVNREGISVYDSKKMEKKLPSSVFSGTAFTCSLTKWISFCLCSRFDTKKDQYVFANPSLLHSAFRHPSFSDSLEFRSHPSEIQLACSEPFCDYCDFFGNSYERLKFAGDAILTWYVSIFFYFNKNTSASSINTYISSAFLPPVELTELRSASINHERLARALILFIIMGWCRMMESPPNEGFAEDRNPMQSASLKHRLKFFLANRSHFINSFLSDCLFANKQYLDGEVLPYLQYLLFENEFLDDIVWMLYHESKLDHCTKYDDNQDSLPLVITCLDAGSYDHVNDTVVPPNNVLSNVVISAPKILGDIMMAFIAALFLDERSKQEYVSGKKETSPLYSLLIKPYIEDYVSHRLNLYQSVGSSNSFSQLSGFSLGSSQNRSSTSFHTPLNPVKTVLECLQALGIQRDRIFFNILDISLERKTASSFLDGSSDEFPSQSDGRTRCYQSSEFLCSMGIRRKKEVPEVQKQDSILVLGLARASSSKSSKRLAAESALQQMDSWKEAVLLEV